MWFLINLHVNHGTTSLLIANIQLERVWPATFEGFQPSKHRASAQITLIRFTWRTSFWKSKLGTWELSINWQDFCKSNDNLSDFMKCTFPYNVTCLRLNDCDSGGTTIRRLNYRVKLVSQVWGSSAIHTLETVRNRRPDWLTSKVSEGRGSCSSTEFWTINKGISANSIINSSPFLVQRFRKPLTSRTFD